MATTATEQAYPASGEAYTVEIMRVYLSGAPDLDVAATEVAVHLEQAADVLGSTTMPSTGRWHGIAEPGRVIELAYQPTPEKAENMSLALQYLRDRLGLTFFVTAERATAMEIY